jgi:hypothetical protein
LRAVFPPRSERLIHYLEDGSVNAFRLTMRAADNWESPRFRGIFLASTFFCSQAWVQSHQLQLTHPVGRLVGDSEQ